MKPLLSAIAILLNFVPSVHADSPAGVVSMVREHCMDCHDSAGSEGGLNLENLEFDLSDPLKFETWVKVHDRVRAGEMPPPAYGQIEEAERTAVVTRLGDLLLAANEREQLSQGRVRYRRLNRVEYEYSLRDLLGLPYLEVKEMLPEDNSAQGFDNVGAALELSYVQIARYLQASEEALRQAMVLGEEPKLLDLRLDAISNGRLAQVVAKGNEAVAIDDYVGLLRQPNTAQAPWWWSRFEPVDGEYELKMKTFGFFWDRGQVLPANQTHVVTLQARQGSTVRRLVSFDIPRTQQEASELSCRVFLRQGDQIQFWIETLDDRSKSRSLPLDEYSADGVAVQWLHIHGPLHASWPPLSYERLYGDLSTEAWSPESGLKQPALPSVVTGVGKRAKVELANPNKVAWRHVVSSQPRDDARRLLRGFAERAFRRPVTVGELAEFVDLVEAKLDAKECFQEALHIGYQAILCSPEFLFLHESPGRLDDYALASRLSYFLWNSLPDAELRQLADTGELQHEGHLVEQVQRMLDDPKSQRFVETFCGQWLDLRRISFTQPDSQLYPEFDPLLLDSMIRETHAYFAKLLSEDLGVRHLVDSDFAILNARLAELYGIPNVAGVELCRVDLPPASPRGGLLTQASILKVTANGTTTSPVTRGAWVMDRLLGQPAPPPPANVPAVEPDLRGTTTLRQQLAAHRSDLACASCHAHIDPAGFALESFDVIGGWRERYRSLEVGQEVNLQIRGGRPVKYKLGLPVDASGELSDGRRFADFQEFRQLMLTQEQQLARNLVRRLIVYATGGEIEFADRDDVEQIVNQTRPDGYGLRSLVQAVVLSDAFRNK